MKRAAIAVLVLLGLGYPRDSLAQCGGGCIPPQYFALVDSLDFDIRFSLSDQQRNQFAAALSDWQSEIRGQGHDIYLRLGSSGVVIQVVLDYNLEGTDIWGIADTNSMVLSLRPSAFAFGSGFLDFLFRHEVGHFAGLGHSPGNCMGDSVMVGADPRYDYGYATGVTGADNCAISSLYQYIPPDPNMCDGYGTGCSPVIIAFSGELRLTPPSVWFDLAATGFPQHVSWIDVAADAGFLVLDRSLNGVIDDGRELFGNITPLSWGLDGESTTDGFTALAWFDEAANGGNGDGWLGPDDTVFALLRIWTDSNHNGSSEPGELHLLDSVGIVRLSLDARDAGRRDRYGNAFRYRAKVQVLNPQGRQVDRFAYDVFLVIGR